MTAFRAELTIDTIGVRGDGIARMEGGAVYVPATAPGDRVKVAITESGKDRFQGRLLEVVEPGPARTDPVCSHFAQCGGCALQHLNAGAYGAWKQDLLVSTLERNGLEAETVDPLHQSPPGRRRRATFAVVRRKADAVVGFHARHSHQVIDLNECPVVAPDIAELIPAIRDWAVAALRTGDTADVFVAQTDSGIDVLVRTVARLGGKGRTALVDLLARHDLARVARAHPRQDGVEILAEARPVRAVFEGVPVALAPGAFSQATRDGEDALAGFVRREIEGAKMAADLFCGSGAFAVPLALAGCEVFAADIDKSAVANLQAAAQQAGLANLRVEQRNLMRKPVPADLLDGGDAVIFDPPRAGAKEQAIEIAASRVSRVIAISCNPGTFARDARILVENGYRLTRIMPVDQFTWSPHLELAARFDFAG